jgi:hypothetical protein
MRFFEFKLPAPGSAFDAELKQHLLTLVNDAKKLPETDPKRIQFNQFLQNIKAKAGITEDPVAEVDTETVNAVLSFLAKQGDKTATMYLMDGAKILGDKRVQAALQKKAEVHTELGKTLGVEEYKQLDTYISKLLQRIPGEDTPAKVAAMRTMFEGDRITPDEAKKFLLAATEGKVINMLGIINSPTAGVGESVDDYVNPELLNTYKKIILDFFGLMPSKTGGNIGPGEVAFILLGNPAEKVSKGDLLIGAEKYEIKASGTKLSAAQQEKQSRGIDMSGAGSPSSAILGGDKIPIAKGLWPDIKVILKKYGIKDVVEPSKRKEKAGELVPRYKLTKTGMAQFNNAFRTVSNLSTIPARAKLLGEILQKLYPTTVNAKTYKKLEQILEKNGGFLEEDNNGTFMRYVTYLALQTYRQDPGKENFIFFNKNSRTFRVFKGKAFDQELQKPNGDLRIIKGIDWNDGSYKASPGLYLL